MHFTQTIRTPAIGILLSFALATAIGVGPGHAQISSFLVSSDRPTTIPTGQLTTFPDEHVTFMPLGGTDYLVFGSSGLQGGTGGAVVLQTQDLKTFNFATALGYNEQVMTPPFAFTSCNPNLADNTEFDENYVGPGTVVQDPTLPTGNLIMIYEAENHCPGGQNQFDYYATSGLARSSDNGKTWPAPIDAALGGPNRYPALIGPTPEPSSPNNMNLGNAIPTAFVDGNYLYIVYENVEAPGTVLRIARANLITDNVAGTLQFHKWYNGSFSQPGRGGLDTLPLPAPTACNGRQGSLAHDDDLDLYVLIFFCTNGTQRQAAWYYSTTASLDTEVWTTPQPITGSLGSWQIPCPEPRAAGGTQFDGFYPSIMSPGLPVGHIHNTGRIYFLDGCDAGTVTTGMRNFNYRHFTIIAGVPPTPVGIPSPSSPTSPSDFDAGLGTTFMQVGILPVPGLTSFDISYVNSTIHGGSVPDGLYSLADRSNKVIDTWLFAFNPPLYFGQTANFVGAVGNPVNNDLSGPNGQLTFANPASGQFEIWAGDGPQANVGCPAFLNGSCSTVKVMDYFTAGAVHVIATNGAARAGKLCHDPDHHLIMVANDAEYDFKFGTPFVSWISTDSYQVVAQMLIPQATNGIEQCQYDQTTGFYFLNLPEVNGPGNDTADGSVLVITPPTSSNQFTPAIAATYIIPTIDCAGPQGMAIGPEPQLLLGCNAVGPNGVQNSLNINKHTGAVLAIGWGVGGADEVWFNPGDSHYYITGPSLPTPALAVVDGTGAGAVDQLIATPKIGGVSAHSIAGSIGSYVDGSGVSWKQVFVVPTAGGVNIFSSSTNTPDADDVSSPAQAQ